MIENAKHQFVGFMSSLDVKLLKLDVALAIIKKKNYMSLCLKYLFAVCSRATTQSPAYKKATKLQENIAGTCIFNRNANR